MRSCLLILASTLLSLSVSLPVKRGVFGPQCYKLESPFCQDVDGFPSSMNMNTTVAVSERDDTEGILKTFIPLIETECATYLKRFLCFSYYPLCLPGGPTGDTTTIKPCRQSCQAFRNKCELFVIALGEAWPKSLDCDALPDTNLCMPVPLPGEQTTKAPRKCEDCQVQSKPLTIVEQICKKEAGKMFVKARVLTKEVSGDAKSLIYNIQVEQILASKEAGSTLKTHSSIWIVTSSTEDCDCHNLVPHQSYLLGLDTKVFGSNTLYVLNDSAVVAQWSLVKDIEKEVDNCST